MRPSSYIHLTLLTLFSHFLFLCSYWGCDYVTGHGTEFLCVRKQVPKSWFECYVDYTSRDKEVREAVEQHNSNKPELFCHFLFHNSRAKGKGGTADVIYCTLQGLWHSSHHILLSKLQRQIFDGCTFQWVRIGWMAAPREEWSRAQCPSWDWWQVLSHSTAVFRRAAVLLKTGLCPNTSPKHIFRKQWNVKMSLKPTLIHHFTYHL